MATHTIGTGGDFTTVQAWEDDLPATMTEQRIGQVMNEELVTAGTCVAFSAHVTTASFNIILEAVSGGSFKDNANVRTNALRYNAANGAALRNSVDSGNGITFTGACPDIIIRNLQLKMDGTGAYRSALSVDAGSTNAMFKDLILEATQNGGTRGMVEPSQGTFVNCLIIQRGTAATGVFEAGAACEFIGCTIVRPSNITAAGYGIDPVYSGCVIKNCAIFGFTNDVRNRPAGPETDYNATPLSDAASGLSDPATDHNVYSVTYDTSLFVQPSDAGGSHDFRLVAECALENAGLYDGTNSPEDISGAVRSDPPEIGAWEFVATGQLAPVFLGPSRSNLIWR